MAIEQNILMKQWNGTDYNIQYPRTKWDNIIDRPTALVTQSDLNSLHKTSVITLGVNSWENNTQTVAVDGVKENNIVVVTYAVPSRDVYKKSGIYCSAQGVNSLTFMCDKIPTDNVSVNVMIIG